MARGGPDWYGQLGVTYGTLNRAFNSILSGAGETQDLIEVKGRGILLGGALYSSATAAHDSDIPRLYIDGIEVAGLPFAGLYENGLDSPELYPIFILKFDELIYRYSAGIVAGITFGQSFKLTYENKAITDTTAWIQAFYGLIV